MSDLKVAVLPVTPFEQNCTLFWCDKTRAAVVIDPGGDVSRIAGEIDRQELTLSQILITHGHVDHAGGAAELAARYRVSIVGPHEADDYWLAYLEQAGREYGFVGVRNFTPDRWLTDGDEVRFGEHSLKVLHCPGHTPGHVVFYHAGEKLAQVGDVLFHGSIGRTDFPGGDHGQLIASIKRKLFPLGDDVRFIPGHGPASTFGEERRHNPFLQGPD